MLIGNSDRQLTFVRKTFAPIDHPVLLTINLLNSFLDDECRDIIFKEPIGSKAMKNHVISRAEVPSEGSCRLMCYIEPNCVSINLGQMQHKRKCELNNATAENQFASHLQNEPTFTYLAIEVKYVIRDRNIALI